MEKRLRSSLHSSAEEALSTATKLGFTRSTKSSLKSLIYSLESSTPLASSLPHFLRRSISDSINRFKALSQNNHQLSPKSPPTKRLRRSSRNDNNAGSTASEDAKVFVVESISVYTYVCGLCITHPKGVFPASELLPGVCELHDNLVLFESYSGLLCEIANLCEEWWKKDLEGKESLISQLLPFLVARSLTLWKKVDVRRVYSVREAFTLLDFEDESIEDLKQLLLRSLISTLYLKMEEGRKFLAFIFTLNGQLVKECLAMIKSQIPFGVKLILEAYGEIVFRAWKIVEPDSKEEIENTFLQALIEGTIHASSVAFAESIRRVLGGFVTQRTTNGVDKLLFRLAEPVIFRSLQVANANVRKNALHLMLDLFPIEDPEATKEAKDTLRHKQFFLLEERLMDKSHDIRVVAVEGGCRILHMFWEVIPSPTITKLLTKFFDCMTHDSCTEVRLSTVNGIIYLLENPYSHEVLKVLLPRLSHLVNDKALAVRAAVIDLLLALTDIPNFQFYKVVPMDALLSTLAEDHQLVGQKITKLLIPTYFPLEVTPKEACNRFVALIKRSPLAGARFCEFALLEGASFRSLKELFGDLISLALSPVRLSTELTYGVLKAASHLCDNLVKDESYEASLKLEMSSEKLKSLFSVAATAHAQSFICNIVTAISPDTVDGLFKECMFLIMDCSELLCSDVEKQAEVRTAHRMILSCDWFDKMFEAMAKHLQKTSKGIHSRFGIETPKSQSTSKRPRKTRSSGKISSNSGQVETTSKSNVKNNNQFDKEYAVATGIAWQIKDLLSSENTCKAILKSKSLETAFLGLKVLSEVSLMQSMQCDSMNAVLVTAYSTLVIHMSLSNVNLKGIKNLHCAQREPESSSSLHESDSRTVLLDIVMEQLLYHANKLFEVNNCENGGEPHVGSANKNRKGHCRGRKSTEIQTDKQSSQNAGSSIAEEKMKPNVLKMLTALLKFIVDAATMELDHHCHEKFINFNRSYLEFIMSNLSKYSSNQQQFIDEDSKEMFYCIKSSLTYTAKHIGFLLKMSDETPLSLQAPYTLSHGLFDVIASVEEHLGYGFAVRFVSAIKSWIPDFILAFGYWNLLKEEEHFEKSAFSVLKTFPLWLTNLAKTELIELHDSFSNEENDDQVSKPMTSSAIRKVVEMIIQTLKSNTQVLDGVGAFFLDMLVLGLDRKDFDAVLGLLHFVSLKLVIHEKNLEEFKLMPALVEDIYTKIEAAVRDLSNGSEDRQKLESAKALLENVWMQHFSGEERGIEEED